MAELANLVRVRGTIKAKLTRHESFVKENNNLFQLKSRVQLANTGFKEFNEIQDKIEGLSESEGVEKQASERMHVENQFCNILAEIEEKISKLGPAASTSRSETPNSCSGHVEAPRINLPTLVLKSFSESYKDWMSFYNSFKSVIDDPNNKLNNCQKFQYLKSCLKGEALRAIDLLSISEENYNTAWEVLTKRFKNTRLIVQDHIFAILKSQPIIKPTYEALREFIDNITSNTAAIGIPIHTWHALVVPIIVDKLDYNTIKEWQASLTTEVPTFDELTKFLEKRCQILESLQAINIKPVINNNSTKQNQVKRVVHIATTKNYCFFCKSSNHYLFNCAEFLKLAPKDRVSEVNKMQLCHNCFKNNHLVGSCMSKYRCKSCKQKHNSLLHINEEISPVPTITNHEVNIKSSITLLSTAIILIRDRFNNYHKCRVLLDPGSMSNYITTAMCNKLALMKSPVNISVSGIGLSQSIINFSTTVEIKSRFNNFRSTLNCLIINKITENLPLTSFTMGDLKIPENICLADETFAESLPIDLLIGTELFLSLLRGNPVQIGSITYHNTCFGWILGGSTITNSKVPTDDISMLSLEKQVERFWEIENCPTPKTPLYWCSNEEKECERHFVKNVTRTISGKFSVRLPFKANPPNLGESRTLALKQFLNLEKHTLGKPNLRADYVNFMREYIDLGHMQRVNENEEHIKNCSYLPHHAVLKDSTSTKLRVVFNASAKTTNQMSLNDNLLAGPTIQQELFSIITRFRTWKYVITGDIEKMYRMIGVSSEDTNYQRILWRESPEQPIQSYKLETITYGTKPASFLATRCILELANLNETKYPIASNTIKNDMYVDDLLTGANSVNELIQLRDQIIGILNQGGFRLRKWASNNVTLIPESDESSLQNLMQVEDWYHVKSSENAADILSRGALPSQLKDSELWWKGGPQWLCTDKNLWQVNSVSIESEQLPERRNVHVSLTTTLAKTEQLPVFVKYSSFIKLKRVLAWSLRFIHNCKNIKNKQGGELTVPELDLATQVIVRTLQRQNFTDDYERLLNKVPLNNKSKLLPLSPFLDHNNLIRVGSRLKNSTLAQDVKYPILFPKHHLTEVIIMQEHKEQLHSGLQGTIAAIRQKFWLISTRSTVRKVLRKCFTCNRVKPVSVTPPIGNLPKSRVTPTRPFMVCGVDYAGPILIKDSRGREKRLIKAYIALFVCFSTKAVHLELVGDLTTESFLSSLRRLIGRRGMISDIYSDNATNFVGADKELKTFFKSSSFNEVQTELINKGIKWHYIPPRSPHMGGIWEINVKAVKYHLKETLGESHLTYEEMYTLLVRIESVLNSRPLTPLSTDPNDFQALTPFHFLIGGTTESSFPEIDITTTSSNRLSRWQLIEKIRQHFWQRWSKEYLTEHLTRVKTKDTSSSVASAIQPGSLVVLVDENTPPQVWKMGGIVQMHPGNDGIVRVVRVRTSNGVTKRAVRKIRVLPTSK